MAAAIPAVAGAVVGGLMNKGNKTQTVQQTADPWIGAQPALETLYNNAQNNFYDGGPQYYPGQTYAGQGDATMNGLNAIYNRATNGSPVLDNAQDMVARTANDQYLYSNPALGGLYDASNFNIMGGQGMDMLGQIGQGYGQGMTEGLQGLSDIGGGSQLGSTLGLSDLQRIGSGANIGRTPGSQQLAAIGNGSMLNANPYVDDMFNAASEGVGRQFANNVMPGVASMYSQAGRYGSGAMQEGMGQAQAEYGNTLNNLASGIYGQNYANERQLQQSALGQLGQIGLAERGQQLQGLSSLGQFSQNEKAQQIQALANAGQISTAERNQMLSALQSMGQFQLQGQGLKNQALGQMSDAFGRERQMQMQAASMAPQLAQADYYDLDRILQGGLMQDSWRQNEINADIARWDFNQNAPQQQLAFLSNIMSGAAPYKSNSGSTTTPGNPLAGAMGGMMMGNALSPYTSGLLGGGGGQNVYANTGPGDAMWGMDLGFG